MSSKPFSQLKTCSPQAHRPETFSQLKGMAPAYEDGVQGTRATRVPGSRLTPACPRTAQRQPHGGLYAYPFTRTPGPWPPAPAHQNTDSAVMGPNVRRIVANGLIRACIGGIPLEPAHTARYRVASTSLEVRYRRLTAAHVLTGLWGGVYFLGETG